MSKVINLGKVRKARARAEKRAEADANAAKHGRTKAQRQAEDTQARREETRLDGHKREDP